MTQSTALARHDNSPAQDPIAITARLRKAEAEAHLVSPATSVQMIPEGCGVAITTVRVSTNKEDGEIYDVGMGKFGLAKAALDRIGIAAGISWDARQSRRLDDGSDPNYVMFLAVGHFRTFDGQRVEIMGTKEMDLRNGSPQCAAIQARAKDGNSRDKQIREMRLHILGHAESKARLRAIRSIGIRTSYTMNELAKPFVVARLMWTGQTDDPELRRAFAMKQADAMLGGMTALYGEPALAALPAPTRAPMPIRPPAVGSVGADDDDFGAPPAPRQAATSSAQNTTRTVGVPAALPNPARNANAAWPWDAKKEGDPAKGTPLTQVSDDALDRLATYCEKKAADGGRFADRDGALAADARAEIAARKEHPPTDPGTDPDDRGDDPNAY